MYTYINRKYFLHKYCILFGFHNLEFENMHNIILLFAEIVLYTPIPNNSINFFLTVFVLFF